MADHQIRVYRTFGSAAKRAPELTSSARALDRTAADTFVSVGLNAAEAARRLEADGPNELPTARRRTRMQLVRDVLREPMLLLLVGAGTVNFFLSEPLDGFILLFGVVVVIAISTYQSYKTESALVALRDLSSPRALVMRDGGRVRIAGREVVRGDVVLLAEGDRVPADAVVLECVNLSVDESALTGESVPVRKSPVPGLPESAIMGDPGGEATPWLFSATLVVKGHGTALVKQTGPLTELGRIGTALRSIPAERTRLQREVDRLVRVIAPIGLMSAAVVTIVFGLTRHAWLEGLLAGIATAMSMLPEEFPVVLTVFLAFGGWRMSQHNVLTRRTAVIETLGSATAICVDKTGTLTMNSMTVRSLIVDGGVHDLVAAPLPEQFHLVAEYAVLASASDPFDPVDRAVRDLGQVHLAGTEHLHSGWDLVREYPLSEKLLALSHVWRSPDRNSYVVAAKGAPESIADLCHLEAAAVAELTRQVEAAAASGQRVLAVARAVFSQRDVLPSEQHDFAFEFLGLVGLHDPVRPGVANAVAECQKAGVRIVMITGDYPGTALAIAREVGIDPAAGAITGPELAAMSDDELAGRIPTVNVFARMAPDQKLQLVRALKANNEIIGMTGDGVNDAPALRAADIGIAMGERGTDVARESADLVITDDDFASIAAGIRLGRGIFHNLRKAMAYIVAIHVTIFGMSLIPVFVPGWPLVLLPVQLAFLELIIDPACSVVFESEQIDPLVMDEQPRAVGEPLFRRRVLAIAVLQGLSVLAAVLGVYLWAVLGERPDDAVRSVTFAALVFGNLALILVNRSWRLSAWRSLRERRNRALKWILAATAVALVAVMTVPALLHTFNFEPMRPSDWIVAVSAAALGVAWFEIYKTRSHAIAPEHG